MDSGSSDSNSGQRKVGANERARRRLAYALLARMRLRRFLRSHEPRTVLALASGLNGAISMLLLSLVAVWTHAPFVFPSVGASAFILFYRPLVEAASPRNTVLGHAFGVGVGWLSIALFGLVDRPFALDYDMDWRRIGAIAVAVGGTCAAMVRFRAAHPPAAATALVVSMGLMPSLDKLPWLLAAVALLVLQAIVMHRFAGVPYPLWAAQRKDQDQLTDVYGLPRSVTRAPPRKPSRRRRRRDVRKRLR